MRGRQSHQRGDVQLRVAGGADSGQASTTGDLRRGGRGAGRHGAAFAGLYAGTGRPSIPPERVLKALLLQAFYSIRSECQFVETGRLQLPAAATIVFHASYDISAFVRIVFSASAHLCNSFSNVLAL